MENNIPKPIFISFSAKVNQNTAENCEVVKVGPSLDLRLYKEKIIKIKDWKTAKALEIKMDDLIK